MEACHHADHGADQLKNFSRQPTRGERALAVVLNAALVLLFCALGAVFAFRGMWIPTGVSAAVAVAASVMLLRAAFGDRRALNRKERYWLAWVLVSLGVAGLCLVLLTPQGQAVHRLLVVAGSATLIAAGLVGIRRRAIP
jgi:drug/metabolite transporter (DMT)-like permease